MGCFLPTFVYIISVLVVTLIARKYRLNNNSDWPFIAGMAFIPIINTIISVLFIIATCSIFVISELYKRFENFKSPKIIKRALDFVYGNPNK